MDAYKQRILQMVPPAARSLPIRQLEDGISNKPPTNVELRRWGAIFKPLDFQQDLILGVSERIRNKNFCALLSMPTGTGKTLTTSRIVLDTLVCPRSNMQQALWIAPQRELLYQASEAIQSAWWSGYGPDSLDIRIVGKSKCFSLASRPTCSLMTPAMAKKLVKAVRDRISVVIFDEAHHVAAKVFLQIWEELTSRERKNLILALGLSATPTREDETELNALKEAFNKTIIAPRSLGAQPLENLIKLGVVSRPFFKNLPGVPSFAKQKSLDDLRSHRSLILDEDRWRSIIECLTKYERGQVVVFALDKHHGKVLTQHLCFLNERAEYVDSDTPIAARIGVFERFRNKTTRILINVALLIEGVDCPASESVLLTYPVRSHIRLRQMIGRVLRGPAIGGTRNCRVWAAEGSQTWMENLLFGADYRYSGWRVIKLP